MAEKRLKCILHMDRMPQVNRTRFDGGCRIFSLELQSSTRQICHTYIILADWSMNRYHRTKLEPEKQTCTNLSHQFLGHFWPRFGSWPQLYFEALFSGYPREIMRLWKHRKQFPQPMLLSKAFSLCEALESFLQEVAL